MKFIKKYILLIFLIENLLTQSSVFGLSQWFFYLMLAVGAALMLDKTIWSRQTFAECKPLYLIALVYVLYQFTLGYDTITMRSLIYLLAKVTTFVIISVSVVSDWEFNARKVPLYLAFVVIAILLFGLNNAENINSGERLELGFGNTNSTSILSAFCLSITLFFWNPKRSVIYVLFALLALYAMLAGGGRNAILIFGVSIIVWSGFSVKKIIPAALALLLLWGAINVLQLNLAGVNRVIETINGTMGSNREYEREAVWMMIKEKPWTGWGFEAQNVGRAAIISEMGSHNGYLETLKFMGYPFFILFCAVLLLSVLPFIRYIKSSDMTVRFHLAVVLSHLAAAFFEGLFVGVHEFSTNIVFYSLAVLSTHNYRRKLALMWH